ncbi:hypothetical protein AU693_003622 [Salmonella enterica subsp. diarizonae]|nr:hypothetical protein [Salmonella enterica subsp. diarizonae]
MSMMGVSQYAKHAGMTRQALYNWMKHEGFPAKVNGKIDQEAADDFLARYRVSNDPRTRNASKGKTAKKTDGARVEMSVAEIKRLIASGSGRRPETESGIATLAAKAAGLYLSTGPDNPPVTFGGYRLSMVETPQDEHQILAGGAFGLNAFDVVSECLDYLTYTDDDETEESALYSVDPDCLYVLDRRLYPEYFIHR